MFVCPRLLSFFALHLGQALGIPFVLMSASDISSKCRDFVMLNNPDRSPTHWFASVQQQTNNEPCELHPYSVGPCNAAPVTPDLAIAGSPCHQFSTQRAKRYQSGSVKAHREYSIMVDQITSWIQSHMAKAVVLEQVMGFTRPMASGDDQTPFDEHLVHISLE